MLNIFYFIVKKGRTKERTHSKISSNKSSLNNKNLKEESGEGKKKGKAT